MKDRFVIVFQPGCEVRRKPMSEWPLVSYRKLIAVFTVIGVELLLSGALVRAADPKLTWDKVVTAAYSPNPFQ